MGVDVDLLQQSINFLTKRLQTEQLKTRICKTSNQQKNYTNKLLKTLEKRKVYSPYIDNVSAADM